MQTKPILFQLFLDAAPAAVEAQTDLLVFELPSCYSDLIYACTGCEDTWERTTSRDTIDALRFLSYFVTKWPSELTIEQIVLVHEEDTYLLSYVRVDRARNESDEKATSRL